MTETMERRLHLASQSGYPTWIRFKNGFVCKMNSGFRVYRDYRLGPAIELAKGHPVPVDQVQGIETGR